MASKTEVTVGSPNPSTIPLDQQQRMQILQELHNIVGSPAFRTSKRSTEFLSYVVQHTVEGHNDSLKERSIGVDIFHRPLSYMTGDDPVVRVTATEVRRRLAQYYQKSAHAPKIRIELPVGSYIPEFQWEPAEALAAPVEPVPASRSSVREVQRPRSWRDIARWQYVTALVVVLALATALVTLWIRTSVHPQQSSAMSQFWSPLFSTSQPVLICLPSPVVYRPTLDLDRRASKEHPSGYETALQRFNNVIPLNPDETIHWKDMNAFPDYYIAKDDAAVAVQLSALFATLGKPSQVRSGSGYTFEDLRNFPAVLIGAFDNRWTLQLTSNLRFVFSEVNGDGRIRDSQGDGHVWLPQNNGIGEEVVDYAVVSRLVDSKTGQLTTIAAGIGPYGTEAAGEFISNEKYLDEAVRGAPADWQKKNIQIVLQTAVTDSIAGPPQAVAKYIW